MVYYLTKNQRPGVAANGYGGPYEQFIEQNVQKNWLKICYTSAWQYRSNGSKQYFILIKDVVLLQLISVWSCLSLGKFGVY